MSESKRAKFLLFAVLGLLICGSLVFITSATSLGTTEKELKVCSGCHQMNPQLYTWKESSHKQIPCTKCHPDSSLISMFINSRAGQEKKIIKVSGFINDKICLECHTRDRTVTPPNSLMVSHNLHLSKSVDCVDCHRDVAHAQVNVKVLEASTKDFNTFNQQDAKQLVSYGNRIPMSTCMRCHNGSKAPKECSACHQNKPIPSSHSPASIWKSSHGAQAFKDLNSCNFCHEYDVAKQKTAKVKNGDYKILQNYARQNQFCRDCHIKRPVGHNSVYSVAHNKFAKANKEYCLVCHNWQQDNSLTQPVTQVVCTKCHVSSIHPQDWIKSHKESAKSKSAESCFTCHDQKSCTKCHASRGINVR